MFKVRLFAFLFFFSSRRRHTRSLRNWSSDVCSSDLEKMPIDRLLAEPWARQEHATFIELQNAIPLAVQSLREECTKSGIRSEERRVGKECRYRWSREH